MKICVVVISFMFLHQLCCGLRIARDAAGHSILSVADIYNGKTNNVASALNGRLHPEKLNRFINVVQRFNDDSPNYSRTEGTFELFAILAASKSSTDEQSWFNSLTRKKASVLSRNESAQLTELAKKDRFGLFKVLILSRLPIVEAQRLLYIFSELESGLKSLESVFGRIKFSLFSNSGYKKGQRDLAVAVLAALAEKPDGEISTWVS